MSGAEALPAAAPQCGLLSGGARALLTWLVHCRGKTHRVRDNSNTQTHTDTQTQAHAQAQTQTDRQADIQAGRQTDRHTDRQTEATHTNSTYDQYMYTTRSSYQARRTVWHQPARPRTSLCRRTAGRSVLASCRLSAGSEHRRASAVGAKNETAVW